MTFKYKSGVKGNYGRYFPVKNDIAILIFKKNGLS